MKIRFELYEGSMGNVNTILNHLDYDFDGVNDIFEVPASQALKALVPNMDSPYYRMAGPFEDGSFSFDFGSYSTFIRMRELKKVDEIGDVMTLQEFKECVECGGFTDYDGEGYYLDDEDYLCGQIDLLDINDKYNKIVWYNN